MTCIRPGDTGTPAALLKLLMADYGVSFQKNDGCATYTTLLQTAVDLSFAESWGSGSQRLFHRLFSEDKIELPWVVRGDLSASIIQQVNEIKGRPDSTPRLLMDRIYHEMLPLQAFATFAINPQEGVWKLYAYTRLAGLDPRFVLVRRDVNGVATHHVALMAHGTLLDPAYDMVGGRHQETVEISPLQALSYRNLYRAAYLTDSKGITALIDQALVLDPGNQLAKVYKLLVGNGGNDPLQPLRDAMKVRMVAAWR